MSRWHETCSPRSIVLLARPPLAVAFLMAIGLLDLISTAVLYSLGSISEMNPLMRPLLEHSPYTFAAVKLATLLAAFVALQWYRNVDELFVRRAASFGAIAYCTLWLAWVTVGAA